MFWLSDEFCQGCKNVCTDTILNQESSQSTDSNSQNTPNEDTSSSNNTENDINKSAYPTKSYTKVPKINDHIV